MCCSSTSCEMRCTRFRHMCHTRAPPFLSPSLSLRRLGLTMNLQMVRTRPRRAGAPVRGKRLTHTQRTNQLHRAHRSHTPPRSTAPTASHAVARCSGSFRSGTASGHIPAAITSSTHPHTARLTCRLSPCQPQGLARAKNGSRSIGQDECQACITGHQTDRGMLNPATHWGTTIEVTPPPCPP